MNIFESFNHNKSSGDSGLNGWEVVADAAKPSAESAEDQEALRAKEFKKRQSRIINALVSGRSEALEEAEPTEDPDARERVLKGIAEDRITNEYWDRVISFVPGPTDTKSPHEIMNSLLQNNPSENKHIKRIIASMSGGDFNRYQDVSAINLAKFFNQFNTPSSFDGEEESFLNMIEEYNGPDKRDEYAKAMRSIRHALYGEKQDYWDAAKSLIIDAKVVNAGKYRSHSEAPKPEPEQRPEPEHEPTPEERERLSRERQERKLIGVFANQNPRFINEPDYPATAADRDKVLDMINRGEIDNNDWGNLIGKIRSPLQTRPAEQLLETVSYSPKAKQILARFTQENFNVNAVNPDSIRLFSERFKTPVDFEFMSNMLMNTIKERSNQIVYEQYQDAMNYLKKALYGKQHEYWEAAKSLQAQADSRQESDNPFRPAR
ncbi:hypothetical protein IJ117_00940 [Candidatus Saccharibacteria bacterium]|nr:hypothetical protein [Candidatus Saccharibacteria bacterium]